MNKQTKNVNGNKDCHKQMLLMSRKKIILPTHFMKKIRSKQKK